MIAGIVFVAVLPLLAWALGHMSLCNMRRYRHARRMPPLPTAGSSRRVSQGPWDGSWQPWPEPNPDALPPELAWRYADLCASKASNQRLTSELTLLILAAALGAAVPKLFTPAGTSASFSEQLLVVSLVLWCVGAIGLRRRASHWDRVASAYDETAAIAAENARVNVEARAQAVAEAVAASRWWRKVVARLGRVLRRRRWAA